ncbi:hypothetical protein G3I44_14280 [Halogeometricum borinquense]|uniref:Uncharacterized protein n=1 Tax=Halogeometricum borinquense TaxID=60847 RepID=A0A6C0UL84_9EURY|nr:hypothetical protein [Halogeometricum borinquense]QIB75353.1 hypothetical protein G3I44_14280 [Halogeometricum borinquense]
MPDDFGGSEFFGEDEDERSPSDHFESRHSPRLGYLFIEKSLSSLDAGLDDFDEDEKIEAEIYANVAVFREVMQYIEEFGIYLYSRLDPDEDFIDAITGTTPREVKPILESIRDGYLDEVVNDFHPDLSGDDWLKQQLGYDKFEEQIDNLNIDDIVDDEQNLTVDTLEGAIEVSLQTIRDHLQLISEFFLRFDEPYNAIKHGNRVYPAIDHKLTMEGPDGEYHIETDEEFVSFLCKTSGDRQGGNLYTFTVPIRMLREQSLSTAKLTRNLYTQMYDIKQKVQKSIRTGEEVALNPNLYGVTESGEDDKEFTLKSIRNPDTTLWLPEDAFPSELEQYELPVRSKVAVGLHRSGNEMVVKTEGGSKRTYDYPLLVDVEMSGNEDHLLGMTLQQNFSFELVSLPLWQYLEIRSLNELGPIEDVTIELTDSERSERRHTDQPVNLPDLPEPDFPEELEYLRSVGIATETEIWLPYYWPPGIPRVVEYYRENRDLTRDVAEELLDGIDRLTQETVVTIPVVSIIDSEEVDEDGNYQAIESERFRLQWGGIVFEADEETGEGRFEIVGGENPQYERGDLNELEGLGVAWIEETPEQAYELFMENGLDAVSMITPTWDPEEGNAVMETKRRYGPKFTWYYIDKFFFGFYEDVPPHLEDVLEQ